MGPTVLFDKSFLQSLSIDESVLFDHFFIPIVCPMFYVETLADLKKTCVQVDHPRMRSGSSLRRLLKCTAPLVLTIWRCATRI